MKKILLGGLIGVLFLASAARAATITIPDGTEVRVKLVEDLSSATASVDDKVRFEVTDNVMIKGRIVVPAGAKAWGVVKEVSKKKSFGRSGMLNFTISYIRVGEDQTIRVNGRMTRQGADNYAKAGVATYAFAPLGFAVKGKDVTITSGTEYTVYVDGDRRVEISSTR